MKRWMIQLLFFIVQNPFLQNFFTGKIYASSVRQHCVPTLNCYSCPAAPFSCPIGSIQYLIEYAKIVPFSILGFLTAIGAIFGSASCAFMCPFGALQDLLYRISPFKSLKKLPFFVRHIKWVILLLFVIIIPLWKHIPAFCAYICPAGTLEAGIPLLITNEGLRASAGGTFVFKSVSLFLLLLWAMREQRPFCRYLCPLGLFFGLFNKISLLQIKLNHDKCRKCHVCQPEKSCPMGLKLPEKVNTLDCIKCGECIKPCPFHAINKEFIPKSKEAQIIDFTNKQ